MKIFRKVLIVLAVIIVLLLVIGLLLPSKITVERSIVINTRAETPFSLVNDLKNWKQWSPWYEMDTTQTITYSDPSAGTGASFEWKSSNKEVDEGKLTITESKPAELVRTRLEFKSWGEGNAIYRFKQEGETTTTVTFQMPLKAGSNPLKKWVNLLMSKSMESTFDRGLEKLKTASENISLSLPSSTIDLSQLKDTITPSFFYMSMRDTCPADSVSERLRDNYVNIMIQAGKQNLTQAGPAMAIYYNATSSGEVVFDAILPMNNLPQDMENVEGRRMPETTASYFNFYDNSVSRENAHLSIRNHLKAMNRVLSSATWEVYIDAENGKQVTQTIYPYRAQ